MPKPSLRRVSSLKFAASDEADLSIRDIIDSPPEGTFSVSAQIKWVEYTRSVNVHGYQKHLIEAKMIDQSNSPIHITVWGKN